MFGADLNVYGATAAQINTYYAFVGASFFLISYRYRNRPFALFIILIFYEGLAGYIGKDFHNAFRIGITAAALYWLVETGSTRINKDNALVVSSFVLFSGAYFLASFVNGDPFFMIFSQYSRYLILLALLLLFMQQREDESTRLFMEDILYDVLLVQIILSVIKFVIMGPRESLVGSVASQGGAMATSLPVLGVMFLWLKNDGVFRKRDWLFVAGLMFIGFESAKRAIWFILPVVVFLLMVYVPRIQKSYRVGAFALIIAPLIFYFGVRLNWSLNPDHRMWGRFDLSYALNYAADYSFGSTNSVVEGVGRVGADYLLFQKLNDGSTTQKDWFGHGLRYIYATDYAQFSDLGFGINGKGAATGVFQTYVSSGFLGIFVSLFFALSVLLKTGNRRFRYVLIAYFLFDYIFYTGSVFRENPLSSLLVFMIAFSSYEL